MATLAIGSAPRGIFVDTENVYWTNSGTGEVMQAKKDGTGQITLASNQGVPYCVVVAAGFVYWVSYDVDGVLRRAPIGGGELVDIIPAPGSKELTVTTDAIFWTRDPDDVEKVPLGGLPEGGMTTLLSMNTLSTGITSDQGHVYWVNTLDGYVKKADMALANDSVIAVGDQPWDITVDDTNVYWTERGSGPSAGRVMKATKAGGMGPVELAATQNGPRGVAIDQTHVYWTNQEEGTVRRVLISGGAVEDIACGQEKPVNVAVDETSVYWTNLAGDTVMKAAK